MIFKGKVLINRYDQTFGKIMFNEIMYCSEPNSCILLPTTTKKRINTLLNNFGKKQLKNYILKKVEIKLI